MRPQKRPALVSMPSSSSSGGERQSSGVVALASQHEEASVDRSFCAGGEGLKRAEGEVSVSLSYRLRFSCQEAELYFVSDAAHGTWC